MISWATMGKITSAVIVSVLAIGTCCVGFSNNEVHAMHMQNMHTGTVITCSSSTHDNETPCASSGDHRLVAVNTSTSKKDLSIETQNDSPALPATIANNLFVIQPSSLERESSQESFHQETTWVTVLPRSHLG